MSNILVSAYTQVLTALLGTELNSLANNTASSAGASILDNTTNLDSWADFRASFSFGTNPVAGATLDLYLIPQVDGSTYADTATVVSNAPNPNYYAGSFPVRPTTGAQVVDLRHVDISSPTKYEAILVNNATGQALAASGNTVKFRTYHATVA